MKIAILGATSKIAKDLILSFSKNRDYNFSLFGRNVKSIKKWVKSEQLSEKYQAKDYNNFSHNHKYDVIINFVGIGDPVKTKNMGADIISITERYDEMALNYIKRNNETKYIFLSSGAVYGGNYQKPVCKKTIATVDLNNLDKADSYAMAKLYTEIKHRSLPNLPIVDVRVFNYFSHTQDMNARFLMTDLVRALINKKVCATSSVNIVRDFITPPDFYNLVQAIIDFKFTNTPIDCYSKSPISKFDLLSELECKFGLKYEFDDSTSFINATGDKLNYYSTNQTAKKLGYEPKNNSRDGVIQEISLLGL
jgi:nucleoside-diphosphate-sugar epimerase